MGRIQLAVLSLASFATDSLLYADPSSAGHWPPRVIFNSDAASTTIFRYAVPITDEQCLRGITSLNQTNVDVYAMAIGAGGSVFWKSQFGHIYGTDVKDWVVRPGAEGVLESLKQLRENEASLRHRAVDITRLRLDRAHRQDMLFVASIRMNDSHEDDEGRFWMGRSRFKIEHPELLLGSPSPKINDDPHDCNFSWGFNYALPAVRERRCGLIEEIFSRYDVDGVELDFMRSAVYFRHGEVFKNIPNMTNMVARIRKILNAASQSKGKRLYLLVRVPPTVGTSLELGLDAETWIREGLVDIVVPMSSGYLDSEAEIDKFVEIAKGTSTLIYGGIESYINRPYGPGSRLDFCRAVAFSTYEEGADGIYLFNYDCHNHDRSGVYNEEERQFLEEIGSAESLRFKNKTYFVPTLSGSRTGGDSLRQLPKHLALIGRGAGTAHDVRFKFHDDLAAANKAGKLKSVQLRVKLAFIEPDFARLRMSLNDQTLAHDKLIRKNEFLIYYDPPVRRGSNRLSVFLDGVDNPADWKKWPELQLVEVVVRYH